VLTPLVVRAAHWRSLNRIPRPLTSLLAAQARKPSSKPCFRCRPACFSPYDEGHTRYRIDLLGQDRPTKPREEQTPNDPRRLPSCCDVLELALEGPNLVRLVVDDNSPRPAHPFVVDSTAARVSTAGNSAFAATMFFRLGRAPETRLAACRASRPRCVQPTSASQHSKNENPYSPDPGSSSKTCAFACTRWNAFHRDRGIERFTPFETLRGTAWARGDFSSS